MTRASRCFTYVAVGLIVVSTRCDFAIIHQVHDPLEVALVDDASVVTAGLWVFCVEVLYKRLQAFVVFSYKSQWSKCNLAFP